MNDYQSNSFEIKQRVLLFKNWITQRFIDECDFNHLSALDALAWSIAMYELSVFVKHQIVTFTRRESK